MSRQYLDGTVVGIVGGHGWMGGALGLALVEQERVLPERLVVSSRSGGDTYDRWPRVCCVRDNHELLARSDLIVLSVRPHDLAMLDLPVGDKPIVSLLAMTSCADITRHTGSTRVIRAMPNAAAQIGEAYMPWYAAESATQADQQAAQHLLSCIGPARELATERELDYMTALTGAGPAYPALLASAMLRHAREMGIADDIAFEAVMQTLVGGCRLLQQSGGDPGEMVDRLIDYQGTTAKGLESMINDDFYPMVMSALDAAFEAATGKPAGVGS